MIAVFVCVYAELNVWMENGRGRRVGATRILEYSYLTRELLLLLESIFKWG